MGSSGAGKSTLLYMLSGMDKPSGGKITYCGKDITKMNDDKLAVFRRKHCGFVFQQIHLVDSMSIMDNVISTGMLTGQKQKALKSKANILFNRIGISEELTEKFASQLSGGEAQRCAMVRALINDPDIVFADEPTASLDHENAYLVMDRLREYAMERLVIVITHDHSILKSTDMTIEVWDGSVSAVKIPDTAKIA